LANEREEIAARRIVNVLKRHGIATMRTLEQKISDAGPSNQRIDPHTLTTVRNNLARQGRIITISTPAAPWYHLNDTPPNVVQRRLREQLPIYNLLQAGDTSSRVGQCLEIAIYRALLQQNTLEYLGSFRDLEEHDDSRLYSKEEPPRTLSGHSLSGDQRLDFLVFHRDGGWAGIEAKNVREWLYPDREEIAELLQKAVALDIVPVLIVRRMAYVTFKLLKVCGVLFHQTYNQLFPEADRGVAELARDKDLLGYHDIRVGNRPDPRLLKFIGTNLPQILREARDRFDDYKDLLGAFADGRMKYTEFAARVRRRSQGKDEDTDWEMPEGLDYEDYE
jgi:hypothetical protein